MSSPVREEFGPTLPELVSARTGRSARSVRIVLVAVLVAAVALGLTVRLLQRAAAAGTDVIVTGAPFSFNLAYDEERLERVDPRAGERLRLTTREGAPTAQRFVVRARPLPAYENDVAGFLPRYASTVAAEMQAADPAFRLRVEGKARINDNPGYQLTYQTRVDGTTVYGKRFLLYDDLDDDESTTNRPTVLADITVESERSNAVPRADAVGGNGAIKQPLRSFRFGDERP